MDKPERIRAELALVLASSKFTRSPTQSRLLNYLVEQSIDGHRTDLKSYSVAVEGLGRSPDFDSRGDTYPRVQVARLRKSLDAFYASEGSDHSERLIIPSGSYQVELVPNTLIGSPRRGFRAMFFASSRVAGWKRPLLAGLMTIAVATVTTVVVRGALLKSDASTWKENDFPYIYVQFDDEGAKSDIRTIGKILEQDLVSELSRYESVRSTSFETKDVDYYVNIKTVGIKNENQIYFDLIYKNNKRTIFTYSEKLDNKINLFSELNKISSNYAFRIANPTGFIHSYSRRKVGDGDSPYGCWLRFTDLARSSPMIGDSILTQCAKKWYTAAPNDPIAVGLYAWTLTDKAILSYTRAGRKRGIKHALLTLVDARQLNPDSVFLESVLLRTYAFDGNPYGVRSAAQRAMTLNPGNLDVRGFAGLYLSLYDDPQGLPLLKDALERHYNPPPWYYVGLFAAAMMRDNIADASEALRYLDRYEHTFAVRYVLAAAYNARIKRIDRAHALWAQATREQPLLRISPDGFFERLPMAPKVRSRLRAWLAPVM